MKRLLFLPSFCLSLLVQAQQKVTTITAAEVEAMPTLFPVGEARDSFEYFTVTDTAYSRYRLPQTFSKPARWQKWEEQNQQWELYPGTHPETYTLKDALQTIDNKQDLGKLQSAKSWCRKHYHEAFPYLVARLSDKRKVGLKNTADLIIWERNMTGDLKFYGHGGSINEDIFTIAGRASWILNSITGENFAVVHGDMTREDAQRFKNLWVAYLQALR